MPSISTEIRREILEKVKAGHPVPELSSSYGVSNRTIYKWLQKKATGSISYN